MQGLTIKLYTKIHDLQDENKSLLKENFSLKDQVFRLKAQLFENQNCTHYEEFEKMKGEMRRKDEDS
jgi:hypothetical protein